MILTFKQPVPAFISLSPWGKSPNRPVWKPRHEGVCYHLSDEAHSLLTHYSINWNYIEWVLEIEDLEEAMMFKLVWA